MNQSNLSRRQLLKGIGLGMGALAVAACAPVLAAFVECTDRGGRVLLARNAAWSGRLFALITGFRYGALFCHPTRIDRRRGACAGQTLWRSQSRHYIGLSIPGLLRRDCAKGNCRAPGTHRSRYFVDERRLVVQILPQSGDFAVGRSDDCC